MKKWLLRILGGLVGILLALFVMGAALPVEGDPFVPEDQWFAGASSVQPSYTGLERIFPPLNEPAGNPPTPAKENLGRMLFFDPVLSANDDISCAHCHHPDYAFSDGQTLAQGAGGVGAGPERTGGVELARHTPSLWNVGYAATLFWDGRAETLEDQVNGPLTHVDEMGADPANVIAELQAIPAYVDLFEEAFDTTTITIEDAQRALGAFQRSLVTQDSPFDRYAAGQFDALTSSQRRGLTLFRSGATRCFECHAAPTFATNNYRVIGVESDDPGRGGIADDAPNGAFRVPSLRNVVLSAPYMHNGSMQSLEDVLDFYSDGGGRVRDVAEMDVFVQAFELSAQEKADMIAFMFALTDESALPEIPDTVPSGLPVVPRLSNSARDLVASYNTGTPTGTIDSGEPNEIMVEEGETIQAAVDRAAPGDTILIPYGVYPERVVVDLNDITLHGIPNENGEYPILDGEGFRPDGVISSGNNFTIGYLHIRDYIDNGVLVEGVTGVHFHDLVVANTGTYGVYPVQSTDVLVERVTAFGVDDAAVYAGQCENVIVRDSVVYGSVIGIELENTVNGEVYNNHVYDNATGILIVILPNLTSKVSHTTLVYDNLVEDNNHENFSPEGATASFLPSGLGILLLGTDNAEAYNNTITGNKSVGLAVFSLVTSGFFDELDIGPNPENNHVYDNIYENNGFDPDPFIKSLGIPVGDILYDASGMGNVFDEPQLEGSFPPILPGSNWPTAFQRIYYRFFHFVISQAL